MISVQDAIDQFKAIIGTAASWVRLAKSQFVDQIAIFLSWALRDALWKLERVKQEFFLATAINDSSVRAHAEGREYLPRKTTPSRGAARITNNGAYSVAIPADTPFVSVAQVDYLIESAVAILPGAYADIEVVQLSKQAPITVSVLEEVPFIEILFPKETSGKLASFRVSVDTGDGFESWTYARLFQNCAADAKVYDEFYNHSGQTGIRFGNGIFGMIPPFDSVLKVDYWTSEGDTVLVTGQQLQLVSDLLDLNGDSADLGIVTLDSIDGGGAGESITEMRKNLHYWPRYNNKLVWDDDYAFYIKSRVAGITWIKCWGEQEQEAESGFDVQNINKIFVSAYAPGNAGLSDEVLAVLADIPLLNRKFNWTAPLLSAFTIAITGKVGRDVDIPAAVIGIKDVLIPNYGLDSAARLDVVRVSDLYDIVKATGYFNGPGAYYEIAIAGVTSPAELKEAVSLDIESSTFTLTYP